MRISFPIGPCAFWDFPFPDAAPDAFATRGENLDFISADFIAPPIRCGVAVTAGRCRDGAPGWRRLDDGWRPERMARHQSENPLNYIILSIT
jgi:putative flavoprotein involved in K+ transport